MSASRSRITHSLRLGCAVVLIVVGIQPDSLRAQQPATQAAAILVRTRTVDGVTLQYLEVAKRFALYAVGTLAFIWLMHFVNVVLTKSGHPLPSGGLGGPGIPQGPR